MSRVLSVVLALIGLSLLASCGRNPPRDPWRAEEESACFARGDVALNQWVYERHEIDGAGICGIDRPLTVTGFADTGVAVEPKATLNCAETARLDRFMHDVVQPAAINRFGQPVQAVLNFGGYGCRTRNNEPFAKLSEHSFGNAIDIAGFRLSDGRHLRVKTGWRGDFDEQAFWYDVASGACQMFRTTLGPGSDGFHEDHLHVDLLRHDKTGKRSVCDPRVQPMAPSFMTARNGGTLPSFGSNPGSMTPVAKLPSLPGANTPREQAVVASLQPHPFSQEALGQLTPQQPVALPPPPVYPMATPLPGAPRNLGQLGAPMAQPLYGRTLGDFSNMDGIGGTGGLY